MEKILATGIDISEFNGNVNISALKNLIDFAIIRCGYGGDYESQDDTEFEANVSKCEAAGVPYGVYLYSYAKNTDMAKSEAEHTLRLLKGKLPLYGVWYDVEDSTLPADETLIDNVITYCDTVKAAGYYCGVYSFLYWMQTRLNSPGLAEYDKWVAQWNDTLDYSGNAGMWQFTNNAVLNGKRFDMNYAFRDYPTLIRGMEGTGMTREEVAQLAREEAESVYLKNEERYKTVDSLPEWAREAVRRVYSELELNGTGNGAEGSAKIDASRSYVRALYVIDKLIAKLNNGDFGGQVR